MTEEEFKKLSKEDQEKVLKGIEGIQDAQEEIKDGEKDLSKLSMKDLKEMFADTIKSYVKPMDRVDKKYNMFPGIGNDKSMADDTSKAGLFAKSSMFMKALIGKDVQVLNTMHEEQRIKANLSEGTTTAGGFLVPEEFRAEIVRLAPQYGVIRANARVIPMRYDTLNIPAAGTTEQSAIWTNEAAKILQTDPTFRQLTLTINKLAALPKMTNELLADANSDVIQYLTMIIAEAFAGEEDNQGFNGTGSPFVGLLQATGVPTTPLTNGTAMTMLSYPDVVQAAHNIYTNATAGAKYYFHRSMLGHLRSRITTTGAPILLPNQTELAGYPFVAAEKLPSTTHASASVGTFPFAIFGNLQRAIAMGERGSITIKLGTEGTVDSDNLFEKDMVALRVIERVALGVLLPSAFTRFTT
jgi:HK97 family phage major capsid protein